jgi:hypothetical protein
MPKPAAKRRQEINTFALIWIGITLLLSAAAFIAIYAGTGIMVNNSAQPPVPLAGVVLPAPSTKETNPTPTVALPTGTPIAPNITPNALRGDLNAFTTQGTGGQSPVAVALQVTATPIAGAINAQLGGATATLPPAPPPVTPTISPVADRNFDLGIQVQPPPDYSLQTHDVWLNAVTQQLKLNWVKHQVRWRDLEVVPGQIDYRSPDVFLPAAARKNVKVMLSIVTAPDWAREPGVQIVKNRQGPPADPQSYVRFVTTLVRRYPNMIHGIEVWNEQNLDREWDSPKGLIADQYVQLLAATYQAVKALDPNIIIVSGALSPTGTSNPPKWFDDFVYMDQLIKAGMLKYTDCVGAHHNGYNIGPGVAFQDAPKDSNGATAIFRGPFDNPNHLWSFYSTLDGYAKKIKAAGSPLKLCVTEFGWASMEDIKKPDGSPAPPPRGFEFALDNTLAEQAQYTLQAVDIMNQWGYVQLAFVWNLNYGAQTNWDITNDNVPYSILGPNWSQRPVWAKIAERNFRGQPRTP